MNITRNLFYVTLSLLKVLHAAEIEYSSETETHNSEEIKKKDEYAFKKEIALSIPNQPRYDVLHVDFHERLIKRRKEEDVFSIWMSFIEAGLLEDLSISKSEILKMVDDSQLHAIAISNQEIAIYFPMPLVKKDSDTIIKDPLSFNEIKLSPTRKWKLDLKFNDDDRLMDHSIRSYLVPNPLSPVAQEDVKPWHLDYLEGNCFIARGKLEKTDSLLSVEIGENDKKLFHSSFQECKFLRDGDILSTSIFKIDKRKHSSIPVDNKPIFCYIPISHEGVAPGEQQINYTESEKENKWYVIKIFDLNGKNANVVIAEISNQEALNAYLKFY